MKTIDRDALARATGGSWKGAGKVTLLAAAVSSGVFAFDYLTGSGGFAKPPKE